MTLAQKLKAIRKGELKNRIDSRLGEFRRMQNAPNDAWFSELCFCILTSNSKAATALAIQNELGHKGFKQLGKQELALCIRRNKHRFHNTKAGYILESRCHARIKDIITSIVDEKGVLSARDWLVDNVQGYGMKEASHFLRNVGYDGLAILDRHVVNLMLENNLLKEKPKSLSRNNYRIIEKEVVKLAKSANMGMAEMDLYLWYMKAGDVLK